ncbi:MAG: TIGR03936 family radical SAM-associated protein [Bacillota bacterium]|nr:TIGR03936 family radical SAM-associated protein [Bacillota bacterium]
MLRYRLEYAKKDFARFLSHLELLRTFNRVFRRSALPLSFTRGFSPRPKISFGPPLPVGAAGLREYLDFELVEAVPPRKGLELLARQLPAGLVAGQLAVLPPGAPGLSKFLDCAWYQVALLHCQADAGAWRQVLRELTGGTSPWLYRRNGSGTVYDVKAGVKEARIVTGRNSFLHLLVNTGSREIPLRVILEVLWEKAAVPCPPLPAQVTRVGLFRRQSGDLVTPLGDVTSFQEKVCEGK